MNYRFKNITSGFLVLYSIQICTFPVTTTFAADPTSTPTISLSNVDFTNLGRTTNQDCDNFCGQFAIKNNSSSGKPASLTNPNQPWDDTVDGTICSDLGISTQTGTLTTTPTPNATYADCKVTISDNLAAILKESDPVKACAKAGKMKDRCYFHTSQVEPLCMAYIAVAGFADSGELGAKKTTAALLALDLAAAGTCLAACATINPMMEMACGAAATAVGATETALMIAQTQTSTAAKYIQTQDQMIANYIGVGAAGLGAAGGLGNMYTGYRDYKDAKMKKAIENVDNSLGERPASDGTTAAGEGDDAAKNASNADDAKKNTASRAMACGTAAMFAVLAGVRAYSLIMLDKNKNDTCDKVNDLKSKAVDYDGDGTPDTGGSANTNVGTNSSTGSGTGQGGGTAASIGGGADSYDKCRAGSVADCANLAGGNMQSTKASDSNLLTNPQLASKLLSNAPSLKDLENAVKNGGAGAAVAGTMGSMPGSDALAALASSAQDDASTLAKHMGLTNALGPNLTYSSGGGGGRSSGSDSNPLSSLFGNSTFGGGAMGVQGPNLASFGAGAKMPDIYHSGTKLSLFEIVSEKVSKVADRVK